MSHWLVKSEPTSFSFHDLEQSPKRTTSWEGVRNYAARNFLRAMRKGDRVFFYHSNAEPNAIVGICEVAREAYADESQFDRKSGMHDPKSTREDPRWSTVDLTAVRALPRPVSLSELRGVAGLGKMEILRKGSRLSVTPVSDEEWRVVCALAGVNDPAA